ncbi:unnamed protein product [Blepharisma stoltei]|uniref:Uncharacterized protein n=1 Tax=Blepharisma stoltei TaxID=1481888 RepID=A0AAU9IKV3_9CILI|nr:unnamed protein product [Blepharisma stoltei]
METGPFRSVKAGDRGELDRAIGRMEARPDIRDSQGNSLLHIAVEVKRNELACIALLLENGWDPNLQNNLGATPLHYVALRKDSGRQVAQLLLEHRANPNIATNSGHTALHLACERYKSELVEILCENGALPSALDIKHNTPLHILLLTPGRDTIARDIVEILLAHGARPGQKNSDGNDTLLLAAAQGYAKVIQFLLQHNQDPTVVNNFNNNIVHEAALHGHSELVEILLAIEVPFLNSKNIEGDTPLHIAVKNNHADVAVALLRKGASIQIKNNHGQTVNEIVSQEAKDVFAAKHPDLIRALATRVKPQARKPEDDPAVCAIQ